MLSWRRRWGPTHFTLEDAAQSAIPIIIKENLLRSELEVH